jgi:nucleoside-diphosphate-sugar epimerase
MTEKVNYLLTGATGRLGRQLLPLLQDKGEVFVLQRQDLDPKKVRAFLKKLQGNIYFIHLAWPVAQKNYLQSEDNLEMLRVSSEIFSYVSDLPLKILCAGTVLEAGDIETVTDSVAPNPQSLYAECKAKLRERLLLNFPASHIWARVSYQVSALDPSHKLIPHLIRNRGNKIHLKNGSRNLDFIHVSDVARAFNHILDKFESFPQEAVVGVGRTINVRSLGSYFGQIEVETQLSSKEFNSVTAPHALYRTGWKPTYSSETELVRVLLQEYEGSKKNFS